MCKGQWGPIVTNFPEDLLEDDVVVDKSVLNPRGAKIFHYFLITIIIHPPLYSIIYEVQHADGVFSTLAAFQMKIFLPLIITNPCTLPSVVHGWISQ